MSARRPESVLRFATLNLTALLLMIGLGGESSGQHTPDPYNIVGEYNNQYEPYMYADYPNTPGMQPNQGRLDGRSGIRNANAFQNFLDSESDEAGDLGRTTMPRPSGPGTPYYRAYRRFDQEFNRTYRPNEAADRSYYDQQEKRNDKYFQALREPDPRKRSQLLRDYNLDNMRAARDLSSGRTVPERDREPARDRFTPGGTSLYPENETDDLRPARPTTTTAPPTRSPGGLAPPPRRPAAGFSGSTAPPARGRADGTVPRPAIAPPRPGARSTAPPPGRAGAGTSAADLLDRSELMDRATRATAPVLPRSTAPPAR